MPSSRIGYGYGPYSAADYGVEGVTADASAVISASSGAACSAAKAKTASASTASTATNTASVVRLRLSGALVSSTASNAAIGEEFVLKLSSKFSYGTGAYGQEVYDQAQLQTVSSATATATATVTKILSGSAAISAASSNQAAATRVRESSGSPAATATLTVNGSFSVVGSATISAVSTNTIIPVRKRNATGLISNTSAVMAIAREKWETIAVGSTTWTKFTDTPGSDPWIKLAA